MAPATIVLIQEQKRKQAYLETLLRNVSAALLRHPAAVPEAQHDQSMIWRLTQSQHYESLKASYPSAGAECACTQAVAGAVPVTTARYKVTEVVYQPRAAPSNVSSTEYAVLRIGGGAEAGSVYETVDGSGWAFLGLHAASIGVAGFVLGGGIAFQRSRYGVGVDNLLGAEIVLLDGTIVYARASNSYCDLFWAITGGGWLGFGVVTPFYIQAYADPDDSYVGTIAWSEEKAPEVFSTTAPWW